MHRIRLVLRLRLVVLIEPVQRTRASASWSQDSRSTYRDRSTESIHRPVTVVGDLGSEDCALRNLIDAFINDLVL